MISFFVASKSLKKKKLNKFLQQIKLSNMMSDRKQNMFQLPEPPNHGEPSEALLWVCSSECYEYEETGFLETEEPCHTVSHWFLSYAPASVPLPLAGAPEHGLEDNLNDHQQLKTTSLLNFTAENQSEIYCNDFKFWILNIIMKCADNLVKNIPKHQCSQVQHKQTTYHSFDYNKLNPLKQGLKTKLNTNL